MFCRCSLSLNGGSAVLLLLLLLFSFLRAAYAPALLEPVELSWVQGLNSFTRCSDTLVILWLLLLLLLLLLLWLFFDFARGNLGMATCGGTLAESAGLLWNLHGGT